MVEVNQKNMPGTEAVQIVNQNNYYGLSASEVERICRQIFDENFTKLKEEAAIIASKRVEELIGLVLKELLERNIGYESFRDPDVQCMVFESQKAYARFGNDTSIEVIGGILVDRIIANDKARRKRIIDKAIELEPYLTEIDMNYLTFILLIKHVKQENIKNLVDLRNYCNSIICKLGISDCKIEMISYLNMIGCFEINLGLASDRLAEVYGYTNGELAGKLPKELELIPGDYGLAPSALFIALKNAERKLDMKFNYDNWFIDG